MIFIEQIGIIANVAGRLTKKVSQGLSFEHATFTLSRIPLPFILFLIAYSIETGVLLKDFVFLCALMTFIVFIVLLSSIFLVNPIQKFYQKIIFYHLSKTLPMSVLYAFFKKSDRKLFEFKSRFSYRFLESKKVLVATFAYLLLGSAFLFSFSIAIKFIEYRLSISQLTTVFQGLASLITSFYINPMFSRSIDNKDTNEFWTRNLYSILVARIIAFLISSMLFTFLYLTL